MKRRTFLQFIGLASVSGAAVAKGVDLPARKPYEFDSIVEAYGAQRSGNNLGPNTSQRMAKAWMEGIEAERVLYSSHQGGNFGDNPASSSNWAEV